MAFQVSTGLRNYVAATGSLRAALQTCVMKIYDGALPANADEAIGGATLLCIITGDNDGTSPLEFEAAPVNGVLVKSTSQVWEGENVDDGVSRFFRFETLADGGGLSTTAIRAQGRCDLVGAELNLTNTTLVSGAPQIIDSFNITLPAS